MNDVKKATSFKEAIEKLENIAHHQFDSEKLQPLIKELKSTIETQGKKSKLEWEDKIQKHPWIALGLVSVTAAFIGFFIGRQSEEEKK